MKYVNKAFNPERRRFLFGTAAVSTGLLVGVRFGLGSADALAMHHEVETTQLNAFVKIGTDNTVTVYAKHFEMGQGTMTGLATILAEELGADWDTVKVEWAPANAELYGNTLLGGAQLTGGSTATADSWPKMRGAGAVARDLLIRAAARQWGVDAADCSTELSHVVCQGKRIAFGDLAMAAAALTPRTPEEIGLKSPEDFTLIGKQDLPRKDSPDKTTGAAIFAIDVRAENAPVAVVQRPPKFGGKVAGLDAEAALASPGVREVLTVPTGVAVVADTTWQALQARRKLKIDWDLSAAESRSSQEMMAACHALLDQPGNEAESVGDVDAGFASAAKTIEARYDFPHLAHAPMEPLTAMVGFRDGKVTIWAGSQNTTFEQMTAADIFGVDPAQVEIITTYAGGSFGRRATPDVDYIAEACHIVKASAGKEPIRLVWSREDDIKGGKYRPIFSHHVRAAIGGDGKPVAWHQRIAGQSIFMGTPLESATVHDGVDHSSVEGAVHLPYDVPAAKVEAHNADIGVPVLWWRSVGHTHTAFVKETMMDELAAAAGMDPYEYRLSLINHPRQKAVLEAVARLADWGSPLPAGRGRGIAVHESFNSFIAEVVEVTLDGESLSVDKVYCAVDCGIAVNPDIIRAQMEGGIAYGLSAVLRNEITLTDGVVDQSNFHDYVPLRMSDMPEVEVVILPSAEAPTGVGEPGLPPLGPALANAIAAAGGPRIRQLPISHSLKV